jgi:MraZ protein
VTEAWGASFVKLDEKGRVILPSKARASLSQGTYLTRGQDRCVYLFSRPQFDAYRDKIRAAAPENMPAVAFDRVFFSSVVVQDMDKQGRITVPAILRDYASLERELAVLGLEDRMEIWDLGHWQSYLDQYLDPFSQPVEGVR